MFYGRPMKQLGWLGLVMWGVLAAACGDDGGNTTADAPHADVGTSDVAVDAAIDGPFGGGVFPLTGDVVGEAPVNGIVVVAWIVSSGSPDYVYKFGHGTSTETQYMVSFSGDPPAAALNSYGVGVGILAILAPGTVLPADGMVQDPLFNGAKFATDYAVIYRATGTTPPVTWMQGFPDGFACGRCVRAASGFDTFEVTQCSGVQILMNPLGLCNWT